MYQEVDIPKEITDLQAKIFVATETQELMKAANKIIKSAKGKDCTAQLIAAGLKEKHAGEIQKPDWCGRIGFASYMLTNNNEAIKRWTAKLAQLKGKAAIAEENLGNKEIEFEGGKIIYNFDVDRLQIINDVMPPEEVRTNYKRAGFVWSHRFTAWQRQLTTGACRAAEYVMKQNGIVVTVPDLKVN